MPIVRDVIPARTAAFRGRGRERAALDAMLNHVRAGQSAVLVMRGEAGIGKTALMHYCARQAAGCRVTRIAGVESELEMPFAAVHQLCAPMLDHLAALPNPQQQALRVAFGLALGDATDRFLVGLAVLGLLADVAAERPLVCLVDDAQWLDEPSCQVLGFVGRRLLAESVLLLFAVRESGDEYLLPSLSTLAIEGLTETDARALLTAAVPGQLDDQVRDRIVAETRGNPLALLELPREMSPAELAGGFGAPRESIPSGDVGDHYLRRVRALSEPTQRLLLLAAADPTGDAALLWRAAQALGVARSAAVEAESEQLLTISSQVRFRHPLVRSAAYTAGTAEGRRSAHLALAEATDAHVDPERRVWHQSAAAAGADEGIASALERTAHTVQARAGLAAAAAFLQRSVLLTAEPERRADRALAAAQAHSQAGAFDTALGLLAEAQAVAISGVQRARAERLRGQVIYASNPGAGAPARLLEAAERLVPLDLQLARETYLDAWMASFAAGRHAEPGGLLPEVSRAALSAPQAGIAPSPWDPFLDGLAKAVTDGRAAGASSLRKAVATFLGDQLPASDWLQWGHLATHAAVMLWDWDSWAILSARHVELARAAGAFAPLSIALSGRGVFAAWCGDHEAVTALLAEDNAIKDVIGSQWYSAVAMLRAAYRGRPEEDLTVVSASADTSTSRGEGMGAQVANWAKAILCNGLGRYADALASAESAAYEMELPNVTAWGLIELVEAAVRSRQPVRAREALARLSHELIEGSDWAGGIEARSRALVSEGAAAEDSYLEAVERLARTPFRPELARCYLVYGEWLRREGRRVDARRQLGAAYELFAAMGAEGFTERARRELQATGEKVRKRSLDVDTHQLTSQEAHIARLARDGRTNAEIGDELFLSVRTVEWHLRNVFAKLEITSRRGLQGALPAASR
jgi:DNA-binding CsgD family transcriptional regulator